MKNVLKYLYRNIENVIGATLIVLMITFLAIQVISRYVFSSPIAWTEELTKICFILSVFFGSVGAWHRNQHLALGVVYDKLSPKGKCYLRLISDILSIVFCVAIFPAMCQLVSSNYKTGMKLPVTQWKKWIFYLLMPVTFVMLAWRILEEISHIIRAIKDGTYVFLSAEANHDIEADEVSLDESSRDKE